MFDQHDACLVGNVLETLKPIAQTTQPTAHPQHAAAPCACEKKTKRIRQPCKKRDQQREKTDRRKKDKPEKLWNASRSSTRNSRLSPRQSHRPQTRGHRKPQPGRLQQRAPPASSGRYRSIRATGGRQPRLRPANHVRSPQ